LEEKPLQPLLKLCGNHSVHDTTVTLASSADYIGFVFAKSKRQVVREQVLEWLRECESKNNKKLVALFVNESVRSILESIHDLPLDVIQCHGNESAEEVKELKEQIDIPIWKAIHHHQDAIKLMQSYEGIVSGYIVDCKVGDQWGGTGVSFDWDYIPFYLEEGKRQGVPVFIAGGIRPGNVEKVLQYRPDGIDVSSGIEESGKKSRELIRQLEERMKRNGNNVSR
jgi:phosphoribosylanthranilate isomerase